MKSDGGWSEHAWEGPAGEFHLLDLPPGRAVWLCVPERPALVLGSTQGDGIIDHREASARGIDVVRRRSGGGVVLVHPEDSVWVDVTIPRDDPLWVDDVSDSMRWLGTAWSEALSPWIATRVQPAPFVAGEWGGTVCFASRAPGELYSVPGAGPGAAGKVLGISQRRGRAGARFQCVVYRRWEAAGWSDLFVDTAAGRAVEGLSVASVPATGREIAGALVATLRGLPDPENRPEWGTERGGRAKGGG